MKVIKGARYEGYLWYSDESMPRVFLGDKILADMNFNENSNPFVVEGNLWNAESSESVMIRYVDGEYYIRRTQVTTEELAGIGDKEIKPSVGAVATTLKEYLPHRIKGVKALRFLQYWQGEADPMCEGMVSLNPSKLVFIGFKK